ncbi:MAG: serine/threonine-protein phosphatase [Deltaproteobacteria bacterium]|jgi:serine/threonine protein phosphatase PrpC|nr:serine/threonine-protein phosphatase [Deltaproteobacteria bacterium]
MADNPNLTAARRPSPQVVYLTSWGWTLTGNCREENQDCFLNWPERLLWAVADGVGGGEDGALASQLIIRRLSALPMAPSPEENLRAIKEAASEVNQALWRRRSRGKLCSTTLTVLLAQNDQAICLWVGDSRCYLSRQGALYQCSKDHTARQSHIDQGLLSPWEALRMIKGNLITRALGSQPDLELEQVAFAIAPRDRLLLCTDGLSNLLSPETLSNTLARGTTARSISLKFQELIKNLPQRDNITQITLLVSKPYQK